MQHPGAGRTYSIFFTLFSAYRQILYAIIKLSFTRITFFVTTTILS